MMPDSQLPSFVGTEAGGGTGFGGESSPGSGGLLSRWFGRWRATRRNSPQRAKNSPAFRKSQVARTVKDLPLVQAELKLEQIQVVRNDLMEEDLVVVAAKPAQAEPVRSGSARPARPVPDVPAVATAAQVAAGASSELAAVATTTKTSSEGSGVVWNRMTARLFVSGQNGVERR